MLQWDRDRINFFLLLLRKSIAHAPFPAHFNWNVVLIEFSKWPTKLYWAPTQLQRRVKSLQYVELRKIVFRMLPHLKSIHISIQLFFGSKILKIIKLGVLLWMWNLMWNYWYLHIQESLKQTNTLNRIKWYTLGKIISDSNKRMITLTNVTLGWLAAILPNCLWKLLV
jgi:hypothetical protein